VPRRILVINGHPDPRRERFVHALALAYADGAREGGHAVEVLHAGALELPPLRTAEDFQKGSPVDAVKAVQASLARADHLVIVFPLWLGSMPALLKGLFEQALRPGFAFAESRGRGLPKKLLAGKSARIFVTMGMPGLFYRVFYRAHSLKSLERNVLEFCGFAPVRASVVGSVESMGAAGRKRWLERARALGRRAR
jgi:putative NADPH-quinone reductase